MDRSELLVRRRTLGLSRVRRIAVSDVERVTLDISSQVGGNGRAQLGYRMRAYLRDGGWVQMGDGIRGSTAAERLAEIVTRASGLRAEVVARSPGSLRAKPTSNHSDAA